MPKDVLFKLQEHVEQIRRYEYRTIGKIPTDAKHNGELTHPVTLANFVAATLHAAGQPLTGAQIEKIEALGLAYERDYADAAQRLSTQPRVRRMLEEYRLKGVFTEATAGVLTPEQRGVVWDAETRRIAGLDMLSPTLMILHTTPVLSAARLEDIRAQARKRLEQLSGLVAGAESPLPRLLDQWIDDTAALVEQPVAPTHARLYSFDQGLRGMEAMVRLTEGLLAEPAVSEEARARISDRFRDCGCLA